jgi:hypothetical protein
LLARKTNSQEKEEEQEEFCRGGRGVFHHYKFLIQEAETFASEEEEEERGLNKDLKRHGQLAVVWDRHGSQVPRRTLTRYGLDKTPTLIALQSTR